MKTDTLLLPELTARTTVAITEWSTEAVVDRIEPLTGGSSSLTFVVSLSNVAVEYQRIVLKVAPPGLPPVRNRDVLRQGRIMQVLAEQPGVRVPAVLFADPGRSDEVPPFIAMEMIDGRCVEPVLVPRGTLPKAEVTSLAFDAVRVLADLHRVDPEPTVLCAEPVVTLAAEIDRWARAFSTVPVDLRTGHEAVAQRLHETVPPPMAPAFTHGDYRLGNTLSSAGRVNAVIDWEIWSLGDPRVDVSWLTFFTDDACHPASLSDEPTGMPCARDLIAAYEDARGERLADLVWFEALTKYKEAAATALLIKRARKAATLNEMHRRMEPALPVLLDEAMALLR
ncbi:phosphotransferase family protein [Nocardia sp. XZ_19_231]|uniref:phosphotransferase family protein n=1 Tax=Nocardia sp. XZ_19_231 TaxID=2769252 RepID=UPI00188E2540|nr:phosphotransferase family protein [Nocardia sp. XZ_19_231]